MICYRKSIWAPSVWVLKYTERDSCVHLKAHYPTGIVKAQKATKSGTRISARNMINPAPSLFGLE